MNRRNSEKPDPIRFAKRDEIAPSQIVGDISLEARIAESISRAGRFRESMQQISRTRTKIEHTSEKATAGVDEKLMRNHTNTRHQ